MESIIFGSSVRIVAYDEKCPRTRGRPIILQAFVVSCPWENARTDTDDIAT